MSGAAGNDWLPWGKGVRLLGSHPCGLLAVEKAVGVLSHPNEEKPEEDRSRSLFKADYDHERECYHGFGNEGSPDAVYLLHRLDSATSGVLLLAINEEVAEAIKLRFQSHDVEKTYYALVKGNGRPGMHGHWSDLLEKGRRSHHGPVFASAGGATQARTNYKWERGDNYRFGLSLMQLLPVTGRTHQLRFQCAKHGFPIVGDRGYGDFRFNRKIKSATHQRRLFLHASKVEVRFTLRGDIIKFTAESPLPPEFDGLLGANHDWVKELTRKPTPGELAERQRARIRDSLRGPTARKHGRRHHH
ncbi:RluA family pseudouridine synthase [Cerasicoccus maritimus]|uniref:RluA family pseudouridine synthase n=1 Tax=Cerasicoccus maritimus TaxID=490089 RepID=UPI0028527F96|nr:pseudouridine synthase [Cerasicoccus maritimus]